MTEIVIAEDDMNSTGVYLVTDGDVTTIQSKATTAGKYPLI